MMLKKKLAAAANGLILAGALHAGQVCPDINDIKAEGMAMTEVIMNNIYLSYTISQYNTNSNWGFVIAPIEAGSSNEALEIANDVLSFMSAPGIPQEEENGFICTYETGQENLIAAAMQADQMISPYKLKSYIQKIHK